MKSEEMPGSEAGREGIGSSEKGFTLIETTISLVVMMVVGLGASALFFYALGSNNTARDRELSMAVAQQEMERLRNTQFANLDATVTNSGGASKTVTSAGRQYSVTTTIANTVSGDSTKETITIQVSPQGSGALSGVQRIFGGVVLITQRSTDAIGAYLGPTAP